MAENKEQVVIIDVTIKTDEALAAIESLKKKAIEQKTALDKMTDGLDANEKAQKQTTKEYILAQVELQNTQSEIRDNTKQLKILTETQKDNEVSINSLRNENKLLTKERNELNLETEEGQKRLKELNEQIDINTQKIKENVDAATQQKMTIGNYSKEVKKAIEESGIFGEQLNTLKGIYAGVQQGIGLGVKALKSFKVALVATGIGAFIAAIGLLYTFFQKTEKGALLLKIAFAAVGAVIDGIVGVITKVASALGSFLTGDFKKGINEIGGAFDGLTDSISASVDAAIKLEDAKKNLESLGRVTKRLTAELNVIAEKQAAIADDNTRSFGERAAAAKVAQMAAEQAAKKELELANEAYKTKEKELDLTTSDYAKRKELSEELSELDIQRVEAKAKLEMAELEAGKRSREIQRDRFEQELDYVLDVYDIRKTNLEKEMNLEGKTAADKLKILNDLKEADKRNLAEIETLFEKQTKKKIDVNALLAEEDIKQLNNTIQNGLQLNEIEANRLKEVINERRNYNMDILELEKELNKDKAKENAESAKKSAEILESEVKDFIDTSKERLENTKITNKEMLAVEIQKLNDFLTKNKEALESKSQTDIENAEIYRQQIISITNQTNNYISELNKEFAEKEQARKIQAAQTDYENQKEILKNNSLALIELERKQLEIKKTQEIEAAKETGANIKLINEKYTQADLELSKASTDAKLNIALSFADNIAQIAGETTALGKIAAVTSTIINTYMGAQAAFAQTPGGIVIKSAAAALATATGLLNVKKILKTKSGLPGDSGGGAASVSGSAGAGGGATANITPEVGQGIITREAATKTNATQEINLQPTLATDTVTLKQTQQRNEAATAVL